MTYRALVIDDDDACREVVCRFLAERGLQVNAAQSGSEALHRLEQGPVDVVITDLKMPGLSGIEVIEATKRRCPGAEILLMTGFATVESAVRAMKLGAFDYLQKPFPLADLGTLVDRAVARARLRRAEPAGPFLAPGAASAELLKRAEALAASDLPVLICGEAGTGKETLARTMHAASPRAAAPVRTLRCAALAADLQEAELLGAGGLLAETAGGTLVVAQAWAASPAAQREMVRLLDALEAVAGRPASEDGAALPPRLIVTTERDLSTRARRGGFRPDLFERLAHRTLTILPLRERGDEIVPLAEGLLARIRSRINRPIEGLAPDAAVWLTSRSWPGNVAELLATLERAALAARGPRLGAADLSAAAEPATRSRPPAEPEHDPAAQRERERILAALRRNAYNLTLTYQQLGMSRTTLWRKLKRYGITLTRAVDGLHG